MSVHTLNVNATRGEITPLMHARVDTDLYQSGLARGRNVVITRYGALTRVPGSLFMGSVKDQTRKTRIIPFEFNATQVYLLEFGHQYLRFWTRDGYVSATPPTPYEVATPFTEADLPFLHARQLGDVVYVFSYGRRAVQKVTRLAETNWTVTAYKTEDGPYEALNASDTTLTPGDYGSLNPAMTSNTTPSGTVSSVPVNASAYLALDKNRVTHAAWSGDTGTLTYQLASGSAIVDHYYLTALGDANDMAYTPTSWFFEGSNNGSDWVVLDTRQGEAGWGASETRFYSFVNKSAFAYHRFRWLATSIAAGGNSRFPELGINRAAASQTPFTLTASNMNGLNNGTGFQSHDVGRSIRLRGSDGRWRWAEIVTVVNTTQVTIRLHGHALPDLTPITNWAMGVFHGAAHPYTGTIYEDRMVLGGADSDPIGLWFSTSSAYERFTQSQPLVADDAFSIRLTGGKLDTITWLAESGQLLGGTASALRAVGARGGGEALSHTNVRQRAETQVGARATPPVTVENVVMFLDRDGRRMFEAAYAYEADAYLAREVSTLNEHLFGGGVEQIVWFDTPHKTAICRRSDGKLVFFAYDREQKVAGATLIDYGGVVEDIATMAGPEGTDLFMVVNRTRPGSSRRYIERMAPFWRADTATQAPVYGASAYAYDGTPVSSLPGLTWLAGETVGVWADGRDIGDATVSGGGTLDMPHGVSASEIVVGKRMPWQVQGLRLANYGQPDGTGFGRKARIINTSVDLFEAAGVSVGTLSNVEPMRFEDEAEDDPDDPVKLRTGMFAMPVDDSWQNCGVYVMEGDKMYPVTIRGVSLHVEGEP